MLIADSQANFYGSALFGVEGTTAPATVVEVVGSGAQFRLTRTLASAFTDFTTDSSGNLTISPSSGQVVIGGSVANANDKLLLSGASQSTALQNLIFTYGQCATLYSETGTTGAEEAITTNGYVAIKITTNSTFLQLGELKVFLRKTADVNAMAMIRALIYTDVAGVPGVSVNTATFNLFAGALTTSLAQYSIALEQNTLSASTSYWIVLQVLGQTTGTIYLGYKNAAGSATFATSSNGSSWTTSNFFPNFLITNRGYRGSYLRGQAREGAYIFSDRYYGATIASNGSWAISAYGLMGGAVIGSSSSYGNGVYVYSTNGYAAAFRQQGTLVDNSTQQCVTIIRNNTLGSFTSTGDLLFVQDTSGSTGNLFSALQGATSRVVITSAGYLRVADGAVGTPEVSFINESSTGLYRVGSGQLGVSVLGTLLSRFLATGLELYNQSGPQLRLSGLSTNTGGTYLACVDEGNPSNEGYLSFGAEGAHSGGSVTSWTARVTSAGILHCDNGTFTFYSNTSGLTAGSTYTPTTAFTISSGGVAVGSNVPFTVAGGALNAQGGVTISNTDPRIIFTESDAAVNAKNNDFINQAGSFVGRFYNDARSASHTWLTVTRTSGSHTADLLTLYATSFNFTGTVTATLNLANASGSSNVLASKITGNANNTVSLTAGGVLNFGSGSAGEDTNLYRLSANFLATDDSLFVSGNLGIGVSSPQGKMHLNGAMHFSEQAANPTAANLTSDAVYNYKDRCAVYMKADKLVIAYNNSGTVTYLSIPLDGATTTWTHSTTAP